MAAQNRALSNHVKVCAIAVLCLAAPAVHAQWVNYRAPGVPRTPDGKVNLTAPVARTPDGKPDLSGTWESQGYFGNLGKDLKPGELLMQPWAEAQVAENQRNLHKNDPMVACMPPGVPRVDLGGSRGMPHPMKIVQTPSLVVLLYETSTNQTFRQVFLDGRPFPTESAANLAGLFDRTLGRRHARRRGDRVQRSRLDRYRVGPSADRGRARDGALHAARHRAYGHRDHHRRSESVREALAREDPVRSCCRIPI